MSRPDDARRPPLEAVTFDFWNTLVSDAAAGLHDQRVEAWLGLLEEEGFRSERTELDAAMGDARRRHDDEWRAGRQFGVERSVEHALEAVGLEVPHDLRGRLVEIFATVGAAAELELTPGIADCLDACRAAGLRVGIVCDVGLTPSTALRAFLARAGLLERFDGWAFSDEVGAYKPAPAIFRHALSELGGAAPERAAHVGDLRRTDVAGARALGMLSVRYAGVFDDPGAGAAGAPVEDADVVVRSHAEVPQALGIAVTP